jgi:hypothetical protein
LPKPAQTSKPQPPRRRPGRGKEGENVNGLGMEIVDRVYMDPKDIKFGIEYQRMIQRHRVEKVYEDMKKIGCYDESQPIIINTNLITIDGQHRVKASIKAGFSRIPCIIVKFPSLAAEAKYFYLKNEHSSKQAAVDLLHAKYMAKDSFALLIYRLEADKNCLFNDMIAIKGKETVKSKFTVSMASDIVSMSVMERTMLFYNRQKGPMIDKFLEEIGYDAVVEKVNGFLDFFFGCYGESKRDNPIPYRLIFVRATASFYVLLKKQGFMDTDSKMRTAKTKMSTMHVNEQLLRLGLAGLTLSLVSHFNSGKKKNRVQYTPTGG